MSIWVSSRAFILASLILHSLSWAMNLEPIPRHSMLARCAAHLLTGTADRPKDNQESIKLISEMMMDEKLGIGKRRTLRALVKSLQSNEVVAVTKVIYGSEAILEFLRDINQLTDLVDEAIRPHVRPPRGELEVCAMTAASAVAVAGVIAGQAAELVGDPSAWIGQATLVGGAGFACVLEASMSRIRDARWRNGWRAPFEGEYEWSRVRFERRVADLVARYGDVGSPRKGLTIVRRVEGLPVDFGRALRRARFPNDMRHAAKLIWMRDRLLPDRVLWDLVREGALDRLSLDYIFLSDPKGGPTLVSVAHLKRLSIPSLLGPT